MAQSYDMYQDFNQRGSPSRAFSSGNTLQRQSSRHFEPAYNPTFNQPLPQSFYPSEEYPRYDTGRGFDRANPSSSLQNIPYQHENTTPWNYGGTNGVAQTMSGTPTMGGAQTMGGLGRARSSARRTALPGSWLEPQMTPQMSSQMPSHAQSQTLPRMGMQNMTNQYSENNTNPSANSQNEEPLLRGGDELIPTALVIKNIPFAVKKEALISHMTDMNLPLPYAFNYHFDNGVFRGLAFANFTTPEETQMVIENLNQAEIGGRRLRVEYKKMLPHGEREKIEREKREKRGQLQEQHQPPPASEGRMPQAIHGQASMTSLNSNNGLASSPSPVGGRVEYDLNDPTTLGFYSEILLFKNDNSRKILTFPSSTAPEHRRTIHTLAHYQGLHHRSEGNGDERYVMISKSPLTIVNETSQLPSSYYTGPETRHRGLNRAATVDFTEARDNYHTQSLRGRGSGLLDVPGSPRLSGFGVSQNLRAAKSFADLRSHSPSPVPSSASFPAGLAQNVLRFAEYGPSSGPSGTPNLTPTSADRLNGESFLLNGMNNLAVGYDRQHSMRTNNGGRIGQERENLPINAGPIGSQRPINGSHYEENPRNGATAVPERQPRGPTATEWGGGGFTRPRQNGHVNRGSDSSDRSGPSRFM